MHSRLPDWIDPVTLIRQGRILEGTLPIKRFARLAERLYDTEGEVAVELHFGCFDTGVQGITGRITGELHPICQRCLGRMRLPLRQEVRLGLVESEAQIARLPEDYEPLLLTQDRLALADLVEDELLLALADYPKHAEQECAARIETAVATGEQDPPEQDTGDNAFAVLTDLNKH